MNIERPAAQNPARQWNGTSGCAWVDLQPELDRMLRPLEMALAEAVRDSGSHDVLDVGCGTGSTTLAAARQVGEGGRCVGIDISAPMLALARRHAEQAGLAAEFVQADAETHEFEAGSFDMVISRFGIMFFADPVAGFANLRRAAKSGAGLRFFAWRSAAENPFMTAAEQAAAPLLPQLPPRRPGAPGQFAFADPHRVREILAGSGWDEIHIQPADFDCSFPVDKLDDYFTRLGPVGQVLGDVDEATRSTVVEVVRPAFDAYVRGDEVRFTAACWLVAARSG